MTDIIGHRMSSGKVLIVAFIVHLTCFMDESSGRPTEVSSPALPGSISDDGDLHAWTTEQGLGDTSEQEEFQTYDFPDDDDLYNDDDDDDDFSENDGAPHVLSQLSRTTTTDSGNSQNEVNHYSEYSSPAELIPGQGDTAAQRTHSTLSRTQTTLSEASPNSAVSPGAVPNSAVSPGAVPHSAVSPGAVPNSAVSPEAEAGNGWASRGAAGSGDDARTSGCVGISPRDSEHVPGQTEHAAPDGQTEHAAPDGQTEHAAPDGQTEHAAPDGQTEHAAPDGQTEHAAPDGQTEHAAPDGQTEHAAPDCQTEHAAPDGQTEHAAPDGQTEHAAPDGQTEHAAPDGQTEHAAPDGQTEHAAPDGQTDQVNHTSYVDLGNTGNSGQGNGFQTGLETSTTNQLQPSEINHQAGGAPPGHMKQANTLTHAVPNRAAGILPHDNPGAQDHGAGSANPVISYGIDVVDLDHKGFGTLSDSKNAQNSTGNTDNNGYHFGDSGLNVVISDGGSNSSRSARPNLHLIISENDRAHAIVPGTFKHADQLQYITDTVQTNNGDKETRDKIAEYIGLDLSSQAAINPTPSITNIEHSIMHNDITPQVTGLSLSSMPSDPELSNMPSDPELSNMPSDAESSTRSVLAPSSSYITLQPTYIFSSSVSHEVINIYPTLAFLTSHIPQTDMFMPSMRFTSLLTSEVETSGEVTTPSQSVSFSVGLFPTSTQETSPQYLTTPLQDSPISVQRTGPMAQTRIPMNETESPDAEGDIDDTDDVYDMVTTSWTPRLVTKSTVRAASSHGQVTEESTSEDGPLRRHVMSPSSSYILSSPSSWTSSTTVTVPSSLTSSPDSEIPADSSTATSSSSKVSYPPGDIDPITRPLAPVIVPSTTTPDLRHSIERERPSPQGLESVHVTYDTFTPKGPTDSPSVPGNNRSTSQVTLDIITNTEYHPVIPGNTPPTGSLEIEQPPSFMELRFAMSWPAFCQSEVFIRGQLVEILQSLSERLKITADQIQLMDRERAECGTDQLSQADEILVRMYLIDKSHDFDRGLTLECAKILLSKMSMGASSLVRNKLLAVRIHDDANLATTTRVTDQQTDRGEGDISVFYEPGVTIAVCLAVLGGCYCFSLIVLQIIVRQRTKRRTFAPGFSRSRSISLASSDSIQLSSVNKCRPNSGLFNQGLDLKDSMEPSNPLSHLQLSKLCMDVNQIHREYQKIPHRMTRLSAVPVGAEDKNRYANVLPLAHTRVKLRQDGREPHSSYINANYVTGPNNQSHYYIATQAPTEKTVSDFWSMVWQQGCVAIVMLTQLEEEGQIRCASYWPELVGRSAAQRHGDFLIELKEKDVHQEYIASGLEVHNLREIEKRQVHHFMYTCWPPVGVPDPISLVKLVIDTRHKYEDGHSPLVVHCSPGTGRTCTFIGLDLCMRQFEARRVVDVMRTVNLMRQERAGAIQNKEQYELLYNSLDEYATIVVSPGMSATSSTATLHATLIG